MNKYSLTIKLNASVSINLIIILGIVLTLTGIGLLSSTLDTINQGKSFLDYNYAELDANTCFEEAVSQIKKNPNFQDTRTIFTDANQNYCIYTVKIYQLNPNYRQISISSKYNNTFFSENRVVDRSTNPITVIE